MMSLKTAAGVLGGTLRGADASFTGVSTDTRSLRAGELFVALRGENFDGHRFLDTASGAGAAGAIVESGAVRDAPLPVIEVPAARRALGALARDWRQRYSPACIAIAGSNGKTTTKEMLAAILRRHAGEAGVLVTRGNLNTDIGVSLTLLGLRAAHRYCVLELGTNHAGEIGVLTRIARPTLTLVTNAQRDHLEYLGSVEQMAEENATALRDLPAGGIAIINADDGCAALFRRAAGARRIVSFGFEHSATVSGAFSANGLKVELTVRTPDGSVQTALAIPGRHSALNALAAAAAAWALGVSPPTIAEGLVAFRPAARRLQVRALPGGATLIDDSYNANPDSVRAAIDVLAGCAGPTALVLGDMGEIGPRSVEFHREVGAYARERGIAKLCALGQASRDAVEAFGGGARHYDTVEAAAAATEGAKTILVKGSLFMAMDRVVRALEGSGASNGRTAAEVH